MTSKRHVIAKKFSQNVVQPQRIPARFDDPDGDLLAASVQVFTPNRAERDYFIPAFPLRFLAQITPAGDAVPLLLIALAMMRMKGEQEIALGPALWSKIGNPGARVRSRLLKQIARLPSAVCVLEARTGRPHLLRTGADWPQKITHR